MPAGLKQILFWSLAARLLLAWFTPFGVDEAYATAVAREFSWAFFDHPPLGFWAPVAMAELTGIEHSLIYRAPSLLMDSLTTFLMFLIGREIGGDRAGLWTAVLHAISPAFVFFGVFVLPDGPLALGSAFAVLWLVRIAASDVPALRSWVLAGAGLAVALASKYQAGLIPIGALIFAVTTPRGRRWFVTPGPYVASFIGLIGFLPVLIWNAQNDWISFSFHTGRTGDGASAQNLFLMLLGQGLYLLPVIFLLAGVGIWQGIKSDAPERRLLAIIALLPIVFFNLIYFFSDTSFPHWTMPGWAFGLPLAGAWLAETGPAVARRARVWLIGMGSAMGPLVLVAVTHLQTGVVSRLFYDEVPQWDNTVNVFDYSALSGILEADGQLAGVDFLASEDWIHGGLMATAFAGQLPLRVIGEDRHHFGLMDSAKMTGTALLLSPQRIPGAGQARILAMAREFDPKAVMLEPVVLDRGGIPYVQVIVVRLEITD